MSDRFSFFKDLLEKLRPNNFDDSEALVTAKKVPQTKVDSSGKKRVVISDDSEVVDKKSSRNPSDNGASRFRLRRIAVRREEGRRRLRWFSVLGLAVAAVIIVLLLLTSPLLSVRKVDVEGVVYANPELIASIVDSIDGEPILTVDLDAAENKLLMIPWVRQARVSMHLPSRVTIEVVERSPIAFFRSVDGFNRVIDRDGRVLDVIEGDPVDFTPIIGTGPNLSAGQNTEQPFLGAAELINALPSELRARLLTVTVSPEGEVSLALTNDVEVLFGRPDDFQVKLVGVVNEIKRQGSRRYAIIDVSSGQPSVR
ncbi:MAG: putative cell division protein FtsQ [Actinomycetota bacterium]|jgi:cell division protein FtsQ